MGSVWGRYLKVATFGESHGPAVGAVVDGLPPGLAVTESDIQAELNRRRPGVSAMVSARGEKDRVEILSGIAEGKTLGSPVCLLIRNQDARSGDYGDLKDKFRPGHADYTYFQKYGLPPQPGGGRASGRETAGRVAAGALAKLLLARAGVRVQAYTLAVGDIQAQKIEPDKAEANPLRFADPDLAPAAEELVKDIRAQGDSIGGLIEVRAEGLPPGWGGPVFDKLEAAVGGALLSIGAVKGVEFGAGFRAAELKGSENNDPLTPEGFTANNSGGTLGGISSGQPLLIRLAIKPTPSISLAQQTLDLAGRAVEIAIHGRHDPCLCPRIVPVAEAMTALALADAWLEQRAQRIDWSEP